MGNDRVTTGLTIIMILACGVGCLCYWLEICAYRLGLLK